jgi:hypothetical protein
MFEAVFGVLAITSWFGLMVAGVLALRLLR